MSTAIERGIGRFQENIFATITGRRGRQPIAILEAPPLPAPQLPPEEPEKFGRRRFLAGLGGLGLGLAIEATPARHLVNPIFEKALAWWNSVTKNALAGSENIAFKPDASSGSIGENNITAVPLETANSILAKEKSKGNATETTLLFPFIVPDQKDISYKYEKISKGFDPQAGKNIIEDNRGANNLFNFPANTIVVAPIDAEVFAYGPKVKTGMVQGVGMKFTVNGNVYTVKIGGARLSEMIFKDLGDLPTLREYQNDKRQYIKRGTQFLILEKEGAEIGIEYTSTPVGSSRNEENPVDIKFLTTPDEAGINKVVVLSN